jgi:methionyl-tRNA formyltransferase
MRVIFFGTGEFAVPSLEAVVAGRHEVVLCVTQPDRPQGRGLATAPSPVKRAARRLRVPLAEPECASPNLCAELKPDVGVAVDYGRLIDRELLRGPRYGMVGVHPSLLPKYRGAAPVAWAILNGETTTGVTIFRLNERMDAGDILWQQAAPIGPEESAGELAGRLSALGAEGLTRTLDELASGPARAVAQDESRASLAPKLTKAQGQIDWRAPAESIARHVRPEIGQLTGEMRADTPLSSLPPAAIDNVWPAQS